MQKTKSNNVLQFPAKGPAGRPADEWPLNDHQAEGIAKATHLTKRVDAAVAVRRLENEIGEENTFHFLADLMDQLIARAKDRSK